MFGYRARRINKRDYAVAAQPWPAVTEIQPAGGPTASEHAARRPSYRGSEQSQLPGASELVAAQPTSSRTSPSAQQRRNHPTRPAGEVHPALSVVIDITSHHRSFWALARRLRETSRPWWRRRLPTMNRISWAIWGISNALLDRPSCRYLQVKVTFESQD